MTGFVGHEGPYWQVLLTLRALKVFDFVTSDPFLQNTVIRFGLRNVPVTFQSFVRNVLAAVNNCKARLDDVLDYLSTLSAHVKTLSLICFWKASLTLFRCLGRLPLNLLRHYCVIWQFKPQPILPFPLNLKLTLEYLVQALDDPFCYFSKLTNTS